MSADAILPPWKAEAIRELHRVATSAIAEHEERLRVAGWPPLAALTLKHRVLQLRAIDAQLNAALAALAGLPE